MTAAAIAITAKNGNAQISGGGTTENGSGGAAQLAGASAESGAKASITGLADIAITAKTGGIAISAKHQLNVRGGHGAAAGTQKFNSSITSSGTVFSGISSSSSTKN